MGGSSHATFGVGAIVIAGGLYAYIQKGSIASLLGSSVIGVGMIGGGILISNGYDLHGHAVSAASSILLSAVASQRILSTGKTMPGVPLFVIGGISAAYQIKKTIEWWN